MSDAIEGYRDMDNLRRALRAKFGVPCPECRCLRPRANATIMLPGQRCRIHKHYVDPRPELTDADYVAAVEEFGS